MKRTFCNADFEKARFASQSPYGAEACGNAMQAVGARGDYALGLLAALKAQKGNERRGIIGRRDLTDDRRDE